MDSLLYISSAFLLGAFHALEPGHGKMILMTYLIGYKRRVVDAVILGVVATFTHTFSILILGILASISAKVFIPETVERFTEITAGILVLIVGVGMLLSGKSNHTHHHGEHRHENREGIMGLITIGVSGGIVPCPAALAVLSATIAGGRASDGFLLVLIFSLGLGSVLIGMGIAFVKASTFFERYIENIFSKKIRIISAVLIISLGAFLLLKNI
ncbi:MAG: sulfite exporter TauE/SafE family protein [Nitrospinae bacterium]|nr:sulfite exporter TauE/SafE family protein [Nitrospinota bacterium]